jgi:hypothetical protein
MKHYEFVAFLLTSVLLLSSLVSAQAGGFTAYAPLSKIQMSACTLYSDEITIKNLESSALTFRIYLSGSASEFAALSKSNFMLLPGGSEKIQIILSPECSRGGKYYLNIYIETPYEEKLLRQEVYVSPYYNLAFRMKNTSSTEFCTNSTPEFEFLISNPGAFQEHYTISVKNISGKALVSDLNFYLAPNETRTVKVYYPGLKPGNYNSLISVDSEKSKLTSKIEFTFKVSSCLPPRKSVIQTIKEFILQNLRIIKLVLLILLILLLLLLLTLLIKRNFNRIMEILSKKRHQIHVYIEKRKAMKELSKKPYYRQIVISEKQLRPGAVKSRKKEKNLLKGRFKVFLILFIIVLLLGITAFLIFVAFPKSGSAHFLSELRTNLLEFFSTLRTKLNFAPENKGTAGNATQNNKINYNTTSNTKTPSNITSNTTKPSTSNTNTTKNSTGQSLFVQSCKSFITLYKNYILLGFGLAVIILIFSLFIFSKKE